MAVEFGQGRGYRLRLANGQGWHIIATEAARPWVERLAEILELKACAPNGNPKLIFIRRDAGKGKREEPLGCLHPKIQDGLPRSDWQGREFPGIKFWSHREVFDVICEMGREENHDLDIIRKSLALYPIFRRAQEAGGFPLHAALVERNGEGVLLAASAETGKSTCCRCLPSPWHARCDDQTLVVRNDQKRYLAHPLPTWSDFLWQRTEQKTWSVEGHVPLSAIFFLEQAESGEVVPMGRGQAAVAVTRSAMQVYPPSWNRLDREEVRVIKKKLFDNGCELAKAIPAFRLKVSLKDRFWEKIGEVLP